MATTYSYDAVIAGEAVVDNDVNVPYATIFAALNSFDGENIRSNAIPGDRLKAGTVAGSKLTDSSVAGTKLQNTTVAGGKLVAGTVGTTQLADGGVATAKLADGAVTAVKAAAGFGRISVGTFTGDGAASQAVTIGWQPVVVMVCGLGTSYLYLKTDDMTASNTKNVTANNTTLAMQIDPTGFTAYLIGSHMNVLGNTYYYLALGST